MVSCSHTRIFQVPSEVREDVMQERIEQVRRSLYNLTDESSQEIHNRTSYADC
ncbi:SPT19 protein, partial [Crocuta crocuta]